MTTGSGSGDFSIGSAVWPGTSKVIEETGELLQVIGKLIAVGGATEHWDGDLRKKLVEEAADVAAAVAFFVHENFTADELRAYSERMDVKLARFRAWHADPTKPPATRGQPDPAVTLTTTHVLFEGQPLCGFMTGHVPKDWPSGHNWVSVMDVVWRDGKATFPPTSERDKLCDTCVVHVQRMWEGRRLWNPKGVSK
jgi:hypothetical protein